MTGALEVLEVSGLVTVQDAGRPGYAHLGVPRAGWLDEPAAHLANRLVGNDASAAVLEVTLGVLTLRTDVHLWVAATGAPCVVWVEGHAMPFGEPVWVPAGAAVTLGVPSSGVRTYLAVSGGVGVDPVLGSRSTDTLAWVGPAAVAVGQVLGAHASRERPRALDTPRPRAVAPMRLVPGPRADWFDGDVLGALVVGHWSVGPASNRIGLRLEGPALRRAPSYVGKELASEGMVLGAVQVPPDGQPVVFLADHPVTGGYPVAAVVHPEDVWMCAQVRPGERVHFASRQGIG